MGYILVHGLRTSAYFGARPHDKSVQAQPGKVNGWQLPPVRQHMHVSCVLPKFFALCNEIVPDFLKLHRTMFFLMLVSKQGRNIGLIR